MNLDDLFRSIEPEDGFPLTQNPEDAGEFASTFGVPLIQELERWCTGSRAEPGDWRNPIYMLVFFWPN